MALEASSRRSFSWVVARKTASKKIGRGTATPIFALRPILLNVWESLRSLLWAIKAINSI